MKGVQDNIRESVVKVFAQSDAPDYDQPWQTKGVVSCVGSGLVISTTTGLKILTNAHVVAEQVFVEVRRYGGSKKYFAAVVGVGHECDLALLSIDDETFFEGLEPIPMGGLPFLGDEVTVLGYPIGGDRLSLTRGIVSRIEMSAYSHSQRRLLSVQIDAAINAGNSGGPVINRRGELVGVSFQGLDEGENIGYMIGSPIVEHFLKDMEDGSSHGFPELGVLVQNLRSTTHRRSLGVPEDKRGGVLISQVVHGGSAVGTLQRGDVLLRIGRYNLAADGSVTFRKRQRIHYSHLVAERQVGDPLRVEFSRDGTIHRAEIRLKGPAYLVPEDRYDVKPTYFLYGGVLFVPLSRDYLKTWGSEWWTAAPASLMAIYEGQVRTSTRSEVVILQKVMADRVNQGYHECESLVVSKVQGRKIRKLKDLIRIVESSQDEFLRFDLQDGWSVVLSRAAAEKQGATILKRFGIPQDRSDDLLD